MPSNSSSPHSSLSSSASSLQSPHSSLSWLITGGCGFIGTALIRRLRKERPQDHIRVLDNLLVGTREDLDLVCDFQEIPLNSSSLSFSSLQSPHSSLASPHSTPVQLMVGDIKDPTACRQAAQDVDVIIHLAANTGVGPSVDDPVADMQANVMGIVHMLEAARQNTDLRFVFASSGAPVGEVEPPIHEELAPHPVSPYGASKLAGEGYCSAYYRTFGVKTVALRFGNVYGPGSTHKSSVVAKFIRQAMQGETCEIYGDGSQTRDFIYIDDLTEAILKAALFSDDAHSSSGSELSPTDSLQHPSSPNSPLLTPNCSLSSPSPTAYCLLPTAYFSETPHSSPSSCSELPTAYCLQPTSSSPWGEVFQIATSREHTVNEIAEKLKKELAAQGMDMHIVHGQPRLGDVKRNYSDTGKAKSKLDWQAQVDVESGIKKTVEWFMQMNTKESKQKHQI